ncbi:solute carrier family 46 member 2-like [Brachionichthys hirsutus]|uniref:solute carrier family 46 member 2-like n=1 Tax=Brachionichthys hirsutus TaxID=412623 RepID=UPI003604CAF4
MVVSCLAVFTVLRQIEPLLLLEQLGASFFYAALQMVVKDRSVNASCPVNPNASQPTEESQQKFISDFYMIYYLILQVAPILPAVLLAKIGDRGWRKAPIVVPLFGYFQCSLTLLLVVLFNLPMEVMFGAAALFGLSGGFCAFWSGVMTLISLGSTADDRSKAMMRMELLYASTGLVANLASGHLFLMYSSRLGRGTFLLCVSTLFNLMCLIHSFVLLQVKQITNQESEENRQLISDASLRVPTEASGGINKVNVVLLFAAAMLYISGYDGSVDMLPTFVMKEPLNWNATQMGYGNAAGSVIVLTSFLAVIVFRRCCSDSMLILIGMLSFASGIFFMSFVTTTYMFFLARSLNMFALIPVPMIRSLLSQEVPASSYGITLTSLQVSLKVAGLAYIPAFTKIYQKTLSWFPGFIFTLSATLTVLAMIPISIVGCRSSRHEICGKWQNRHHHKQ